MSGDKRNTVIQANRTAKTVIEVFDRILNAESISQDDLHLIIERITVFDDAIEVKLKSDVQALLCCGVCDSDELPEDAVVVQESANRPPKELKMLVDAPKTDNVISSGDPSLTTLSPWEKFCLALMELEQRTAWEMVHIDGTL